MLNKDKTKVKKEKPEGYYTLKLEIESLKKSLSTLHKLIEAQAGQYKYLDGVNKKLKGELIQLQHEVNGLSNVRRR